MRRRKLTLGIAPVAAAVALGLVAAGCGSSGAADNATGSSKANAQDAALEWARCMRANGVNVEDPQVDSAGRVQIRVREPAGGGKAGGANGPALGPPQQTPAARKAFEKCRPIMQRALPNGGQPTAEERAKFQDAALKFAQCMRRHGVDMPDPDFSGGGGGFLRLGGKGVDPNDPSFRRAQEACQKLLPGPRGAAR